MTKVIYCPVNGWDCPYYWRGECCMKVETGCDPIDECDDFSFFWDRGDDYEVDEDEDYEPDNIDSDMGFDPYMGCFSDDC